MAEKKNKELSLKQQTAIIALMTSKSIEAAASSSGVSPRHLYRWLNDPAFSDAYRRIRRECFNQSVMRLLALNEKAITALEEVLNSKSAKHAIKIKTAAIVLENGRSGIELDDLCTRLQRLEEILSEFEIKNPVH